MSARHEKPSGQSLSRLPSVEHLLQKKEFLVLAEKFGRRELLFATRSVLAEQREAVRQGRIDEEELDHALACLEDSVRARLTSATDPSLTPLVNATGIIVHTNLGRAPLSEAAIEAVALIASSYNNLELDIRSGKRGHRGAYILGRLFPGREILVVNNNAAAVLLALNSFALSREVIISRGELVEIGGSFRVPDILERSGARLREVGTTNKTRIADYEAAINSSTGLILRVHPSNFRMIGFTESASTEELVALGRAHGLPVIEDFGSGNLVSLAAHGLPEEPVVETSLKTGIDMVSFSGDKLLGGPQAGILVGTPERISVCRKNPLARALRVDKLTLAALEATVSAFVRERPLEEIPVLKMIATPASEIRTRCRHITAELEAVAGLDLSVEEGLSKVGGGAAPEEEIPTFVISVGAEGLSAQQVHERLRSQSPPVVARIAEDRVLIDLRTVFPRQEGALLAALSSLKRGQD